MPPGSVVGISPESLNLVQPCPHTLDCNMYMILVTMAIFLIISNHILSLPPTQDVQVSHTVVIKDCGLILSGSINYLGNMRHPCFLKAEGNFQLLTFLMGMTWLYLKPWGQTGWLQVNMALLLSEKGLC